MKTYLLLFHEKLHEAMHTGNHGNSRHILQTAIMWHAEIQ
jgi:hypothetical protein